MDDSKPSWPALALRDLGREPTGRTSGETGSVGALHGDRCLLVGMLVAEVLRDLAEPLAAATTGLDSLARLGERLPTRLRKRFTEPLQRSQEGCRRAARAIASLLQLSTASDQVVCVEPNHVVLQVLGAVHPGLCRAAACSHRLGEVPLIACDRERLRRLLLLMVLHVTDSLNQDQPLSDCQLHAQTWSNEDELCVAVSAELAAGPQPSLEPALAGLERSPGLWLGLGQRSAHELGGWLHLDAELGERFVLTVHLPLSESVAPHEPRALASMSPPSKSVAPLGLRLLIVDDEPLVTTALRRALRGLGSIETVGSGQEAMAKLALDSHYDVVLCDKNMQRGSGLELALWIERYRPGLLPRLVFMTGLPAVTSATSAREQAPSVPTLHKPIDPTALRAVLLSVAGVAVEPVFDPSEQHRVG